ncbi:hypothetical protein E1B28_002485 [Marasmius oreades]|uniref:Uncharacterized protein n=1 Tax=Marasmius oreades TaxID=181124 RepID=A0A9P7RMR1_9AGAR|nr:uncharacterized protein E1B28_002485 [Marasmius oreades]KAG7086534.1 hypothetical protein E1B28_002485 [Marasmius oreades]
MSNTLGRHENPLSVPLRLPRTGHAQDTAGICTTSMQYSHPLPRDQPFSSSRLPLLTRPVLAYRHEMNDNSTLSSPLSSCRNLQVPKHPVDSFPYQDHKSSRLNAQRVRDFPAATVPVVPNHLYTRTTPQHICPPLTGAPVYGLPAKTRIHFPYRSSRLNPRNLTNTLSPFCPATTRLPPPPPLHLSRPIFEGYSKASTESTKVPLASLPSFSLPFNNGMVQTSSPIIPGQPLPDLSSSNLDYCRPNHVQRYMNQDSENVDPATRMHIFRQAQELFSEKIEAPVPVRYHDIAVQSLKTHAANMNNDIGFLGLLNSNKLGGSVVGENALNGVATAGISDTRSIGPWAPEPTPRNSAAATLGDQRKERGETKNTPATEHAADQVEDETESTSNVNPTLTDRINSYDALKLASPNTLIALTEPFLLEWCFDQQKIDRLAAMPSLEGLEG